MRLKVLKTKQLDDVIILQICSLKKQFWKYSLESHLCWFKKNVKKNDLNLILFNKKKKVVGYNLLRLRSLILKRKLMKYYYFDTLIIDKNFRNLGWSKKIINKSIYLSNRLNIPLILICKKKLLNFYKKFKFKIIENRCITFNDHKFTDCSMIFSSKINKVNENKIKIFVNR